jgi:hypothetical protein
LTCCILNEVVEVVGTGVVVDLTLFCPGGYSGWYMEHSPLESYFFDSFLNNYLKI